MKKIAVLVFGVFSLIGCGGDSVSQSNAVQQNSNAAIAANRQQPEMVAAHSTERALPPVSTAQTNAPQTSAANVSLSTNRPASGSTESPMARAIDVSEQTAQIAAAEKEYKAKPSDEKAKENLARARFDRAFLLTEAAQYRAALGDFRKGLKLDPSDKEAKDMHDKIISIFASIRREPPKEGEEPEPMPFSKG